MYVQCTWFCRRPRIIESTLYIVLINFCIYIIVPILVLLNSDKVVQVKNNCIKTKKIRCL